MKKLLTLLPILLSCICLPVEAVPRIGTLTFQDVGINGCTGSAAPRGVTSWQGGKYAIWDLAGNKGTMTLNLDGALRSLAYTKSKQMGGKGQKVSLTGRYGKYRVQLLIDYDRRVSMSQNAGDGSLRIYSDIPGDSQSIRITAVAGC